MARLQQSQGRLYKLKIAAAHLGLWLLMWAEATLAGDGKPFDSAFWVDWEKSVQKALDDEVDAEMRLSGGNSPTT